ncbi:unnamed protein product [Eretmochelys imbricata]
MGVGYRHPAPEKEVPLGVRGQQCEQHCPRPAGVHRSGLTFASLAGTHPNLGCIWVLAEYFAQIMSSLQLGNKQSVNWVKNQRLAGVFFSWQCSGGGGGKGECLLFHPPVLPFYNNYRGLQGFHTQSPGRPCVLNNLICLMTREALRPPHACCLDTFPWSPKDF